MMTELWIAILKLIPWIWERVRPVDPFQSHALIYPTLRALKKTCKAQRALVLRYHNGGGKLKADSPVRGSIHAECVADGFISRTADFQDVPLTSEYVHNVALALKQSPGLIHRNDWQDPSLKAVYENDGIYSAALCPVCEMPQATFVLVLQWAEKKSKLQAHDIVEVQAAARKLARLVRGLTA